MYLLLCLSILSITTHSQQTPNSSKLPQLDDTQANLFPISQNSASDPRFLQSCGKNQFYNAKLGGCQYCNLGCESCHGNGPFMCDKCTPGFPFNSKGFCSCFPKKLTPVPGNCQGPNESWDDFTKKCYTCEVACPAAHYFDGTKAECVPCATGCTHCFGGKNTNCLACNAAMGYSYDLATQSCVLCGGTVNGMNICDMPASCSSFNFFIESTGLCSSTCLIATMPTAFAMPGLRCVSCHGSCVGGCFADNDPNSCLNCGGGSGPVVVAHEVLHPSGTLYNASACVSQASLPQSIYNDGMNTFFCIPECAKCNDNPELCDICQQNGAALFPGRRCKVVSRCPQGYSEGRNQFGQRTCVVDSHSSSSSGGDIAMPGIVKKLIGGVVVPIAVAASQVGNPGISSAAVRSLLINIYAYLKFLNVDYPANLLKEFAANETQLISFNFGVPLPDAWKKQADRYSPLGRYAKYDVDALFLVTFWSYGCTAVILFVLTAIVLLIYKKGTVNSPKCRRIFKMLADFFAWNYIVGFFISAVGDLSFSGIVEFQSLNLKNERSSGILTASVVLNIATMVGLGIVYFIVFIPKLRLIYKNLKKAEANAKSEEPEPGKKSDVIDRYKVLYDEFKKEKPIQISFLLILILRVVLFNVFVALLYDYPLPQIGLMIGLNVLMALYTIIYKPYEATRKNVETAYYEILLMAINALVLLIALQDNNSGPSVDKQLLGTLIIILNMLLIIGSLIFTILELLSIFSEEVLRFKNFIKRCCCGKSKKVAPVIDESGIKTPKSMEENQPLTEIGSEGGSSPLEKAKAIRLDRMFYRNVSS